MGQKKQASLADRIVRLGRLMERYEFAYFGAWGMAAGVTLAVMLVVRQ